MAARSYRRVEARGTVAGPGVDVNLLRRDVGMVFQTSVIDNVTLAPMKLLGLSKAEATSRAEARAYPDRLSGGQQQRVAIVRKGTLLKQGPPEQIFSEPKEERTRAFLKSIIEAGRL